jgi:dTDP-4-dehydrorhamnose reductase
VHALASGAAAGALYTDDVRCPVHVSDLAAALLELAAAGGITWLGKPPPAAGFPRRQGALFAGLGRG